MAERHGQDRLRAEEWVWHFVRGNVKQAATIELSGPVRPADVVAILLCHLADGQMMLVPMSPIGDTPDDRKAV